METEVRGVPLAPAQNARGTCREQLDSMPSGGRLVVSLMFVLTALAGCGGGGAALSDSLAPPIPVPAPAPAPASTPAPADITLNYGLDNRTTVTIGVQSTIVPQITGLNGHTPVCTLASGTLPSGMSLASDCSLNGTVQATTEGESVFSVSLTVPGYSATAFADVAVETQFGRINYTGLPPPLGFFITLPWEQAVDATVSSVDGFALSSVTNYQVVQGTLPEGLQIDAATGHITGTPTQAEQPTQAVTIQATAHGASGDTAVYTTLNINVGSIQDNAVQLTYPSPPAAQVGVPYVLAPTITGTRFPLSEYDNLYSWSAAQQGQCAGQFLTDGLSLNVTTGVVSGTPTASGTFCALVYVQMFHTGEGYVMQQGIVQISVNP